jgi:dTDP-4-dehydrorhamnose reductase
MRILIIGASGLVGSNCLRYFADRQDLEVEGTWFSYQIEGSHFFNTLDLNDPNNFDIKVFQPNVIVHTGALTHVDYCEQNPEESYLKTVVSTQNVITLCQELGAKMIYLSTDYIFDGLNGPYAEDHPVNPLSVYGKHKLEAEEMIRQSLSDYLILRVTNVYGEEERRKNFISRLIDACVKDQPLEMNLPADQYATPINAWDIARALELLLANNLNGVFHLAGTDYLNRVQLAMKVMNYFPASNVVINPIPTTELRQPAPRPLFGGLRAIRFLEAFPLFTFQSVDNYLIGLTLPDR